MIATLKMNGREVKRIASRMELAAMHSPERLDGSPAARIAREYARAVNVACGLYVEPQSWQDDAEVNEEANEWHAEAARLQRALWLAIASGQA